MQRITRKTITMAALVSMPIGVMTSPPASADSSITIESVSYASDHAFTKASDATNVTINGATQLLWEMPDHQIKITRHDLRRAPRVRIKSCSQGTSAVIAKRTHNAPVVIVLPGSCLKNQGRLGNIRGGFNWRVKDPAVLSFDKHIAKYRHTFDYINFSRLVKLCANIIGGKVQRWFQKVVQVRFEGDLQQQALVEAEAKVIATVEASRQCPGGVVKAYASASASARASAWVRNKLRYMVSAVNAKKVELIASLELQVKAAAEAEAKARITIECGEDETPPPSTPAPNLVEIDTVNDVLVNNTRTFTVRGTTAPGRNGRLFCTALNGGTITAGKDQSITDDNFTATATYQASSEVPEANGNVAAGRDQVECTFTQDDGQIDVIRSNQFRILERPFTPPKSTSVV